MLDRSELTTELRKPAKEPYAYVKRFYEAVP